MLPKLFRNRLLLIAAGAVTAVIVFVGATYAGGAFTRRVAAGDAVCLYCHAMFDPDVAASPRHPKDPEKSATTCADCHVNPGIAGAVYTYTHLASWTDLYGHFRSAYAARAGDYEAPIARRAHRTRDGLKETDSSACRSCHVMAEIKPQRARGRRAHDEAVQKNLTCINCHYNLVHTEIAPRPGFVQ